MVRERAWRVSHAIGARRRSGARERVSGSPRGEAPRIRLEPKTAQVAPEGLREIRPAQREVDHRLQEPQLVARVVTDAVHLAAIDRALLEQPSQAVRQLNLAGAVVLSRGLLEGGENVRREDV